MSESGEFSSNDLYGMECCLRDFDLLIDQWKKSPTALAARYSVIKAFELTYEISLKTLHRYLQENSIQASDLSSFNFQDVIRLADRNGLLQHGWPTWKVYRDNRNRTAHTYREDIANTVLEAAPGFSAEAHVLLDNLSRRTERNG